MKRTPLIVESTATERTAWESRIRSTRAGGFRHLRTNLQFVDGGRPPGVIVPTSPMIVEGKFVTAANLATPSPSPAARWPSWRRICGALRWPAIWGRGRDRPVRRARGADPRGRRPAAVRRVWSVSVAERADSTNPGELLSSHNMAMLCSGDGRPPMSLSLIPIRSCRIPTRPWSLRWRTGRCSSSGPARLTGRKNRAAVTNVRAVDAPLSGCLLNMQAGSVGKGYYYERRAESGSEGRDRRRGRRVSTVASPYANRVQRQASRRSGSMSPAPAGRGRASRGSGYGGRAATKGRGGAERAARSTCSRRLLPSLGGVRPARAVARPTRVTLPSAPA